MTEQDQTIPEKSSTEKSATEENFQDLRIRLESDFRKKVFGGIDPQDVVKYVQSIREQSQEVHTVYEGRMNELEEANKQLRRDRERYEEKIRLNAENVKAMEITMAEMEEERMALQWKLAEARREMIDASAEAEKEANKQQIKLRHEELEAINQENATMAEEIRRLQRLVDEKNSDFQVMADQLAASQQMAELYQQECSGLQQQLGSEKSEVDRLLAEKKQLEWRLCETGQQLEGMNIQWAKIEEANEQLRYEQEYAEEKIQQLQAENQELAVFSQRKTELEEEIHRLQRQIEEKSNANQLIAGQLAEEKNASAEKDRRYFAMEREASHIGSQLATSQQLNEMYLQERRVLEQRLNSEKKEVDHLMAENGGLDSRLNEARQQIDGLHHKLDHLNEQLKAKEHFEQQLEIERLRANQAERKIAMLSDWVVRLKDRFQNNSSYFDNRLQELEEKQYENNRKSAAEILREASQAAESLLAAAQRNAEALIEGANRKTQDLTTSYGNFKSDVNSFRSNLQDFQLKAGADMEILYSTIKKPDRLVAEDQTDDDDKIDRRSNLVAFNKIG